MKDAEISSYFGCIITKITDYMISARFGIRVISYTPLQECEVEQGLSVLRHHCF
jgi:hypothetical protein